jgi:precorrin-4 methylase
MAGAVMMIVSCRAGSKKDVLPVNTMKQVVWDMMKADEWFLRSSLKDSLAKKNREDIRLYEQVFAIHHITREQFYRSYRYYEAHPVQFKELLDSIEHLSSREQQKMIKKPVTRP